MEFQDMIIFNEKKLSQIIALYKNIFLLSFLAFLFGCSSSGEMKMSQPLTTSIERGEIAALSVKISENAGAGDSDAAREVAQRLKGQLFGRLVSEGVFRQVVHEGDKSKYILDVTLSDANEVSQGARIFFGVLAGSNTLVVVVKLFDAASPHPLTEFVVTGESASHPFSSENDMDDAIREVVDEIVLALQ